MVINNKNNQRRLKNREIENMCDDSPTLMISKKNCEKVMGRNLHQQEWILIKEVMLRETFNIVADFRDMQNDGVFSEAMKALEEVFDAENQMRNAHDRFDNATNNLNKIRSIN